MALYKSTTSAGSLKADVDAEGHDLVAAPLAIKAAPQLNEATVRDGWQFQIATTTFTFNKKQTSAMLMVISGFGRRISIVFRTNSDACTDAVVNFVASVKLNGPSAGDPVLPQPPTAVSPAVNDGWQAGANKNAVELSKGGLRVRLHYIQPIPDQLRSDAEAVRGRFWQTLVGPSYSSLRNVAKRRISAMDDNVSYMEAHGVERTSGKTVRVDFRIFTQNGNVRCVEIVANPRQCWTKISATWRTSRRCLISIDSRLRPKLWSELGAAAAVVFYNTSTIYWRRCWHGRGVKQLSVEFWCQRRIQEYVESSIRPQWRTQLWQRSAIGSLCCRG